MDNLKVELQNLYADASKHSVYQNIPDFVSTALGYTAPVDNAWRSDRPRLAYLLAHREPAPGETWLDFGANTGFFTLSLAHAYRRCAFLAVEANANHARFIARVVEHFMMPNVTVIPGAFGLRELGALPHVDFILHLNVLHHAGHDFDADLVPTEQRFGEYASSYLDALGGRAGAMLFQMGSNWGGDKAHPLVPVTADAIKLLRIASWLQRGGWYPSVVAYPRKTASGCVDYEDISDKACRSLTTQEADGSGAYDWSLLNAFPGEFYRRALFLCRSQ